MTNVAFIGLGIMGNPMAGHLAKAGHAVTGFNRHPDYDDLEAAGGKGAGSLEEAVADADVVCVMVPDSPDVRDVLEGEGGVFASAKPGTLVVDFSSIRPDVTVELAKTAKERGFRLLDAPVSGGEAGAKNACRSWSGVTPRTSKRPSHCSTSWARPSFTSEATGPGRPSRRPTSSSSRPTSRR